MSRRSEDAMLALANLLQARGDRRGASDYLQRFMLTYPGSPARPRVAISLVRLLFDQGPQQQARACEALRMGRDAVPASNIELRGQLDFYAPRCTMAVAEASPMGDSAAAPVAQQSGRPSTDSTPRTPPLAPSTSHPAPDSAPGTSPPASNAERAPRAFYSVQVAAYDSETSAQRLVQTLVGRGLQARVDGVERPFRVRIGRFTTRAEAVKALADLKSGGQDGFVTLVRPN
jgi:cell division protein FtsN